MTASLSQPIDLVRPPQILFGSGVAARVGDWVSRRKLKKSFVPNVIVTPHCGGVTGEARREVSLMTVRNVLAFLRGDTVDRHFFVGR